MSDHADFEAAYWGDCCNTFDEEQKHYVYAKCMSLPRVGYGFDAKGKRVLDIGGGPVSMLLKTVNLRHGTVVDPLAGRYPQWVDDRYSCKEIALVNLCGEDLPKGNLGPYDEVWIYNCLQHTDDPGRIIANAKALAPVLRMFEWVDIPAHDGHPHMLTQATLEAWIGQPGTVSSVAESGCYGRAFYGCWEHA